MYEREVYVRVLTPIAKQRIKEDKCPSCGKPKSKWDRRTDWRCCSTDCTKKFYKEHDKSFSWSSYRIKVFNRDNGICVMCGKKEVWIGTDGKEYPDWNKLIADHIIPVSIGGDCWDMDNLQTLCPECNKIKTKNDMKVIADYRRKEKILNKNKQLVIN